MAQDVGKCLQDGPKIAPRWPKMAPRWVQSGPRRPHKVIQDEPPERDRKRGPRATFSPHMGAPKKVQKATTHPPHFARRKQLQLEPSDRLLASFREKQLQLEPCVRLLASFRDVSECCCDACGSDGLKVAHRWPRMSENVSKMAPGRPQDAQDGTKIAAKWPKTTPQSHPR